MNEDYLSYVQNLQCGRLQPTRHPSVELVVVGPHVVCCVDGVEASTRLPTPHLIGSRKRRKQGNFKTHQPRVSNGAYLQSASGTITRVLKFWCVSHWCGHIGRVSRVLKPSHVPQGSGNSDCDIKRDSRRHCWHWRWRAGYGDRRGQGLLDHGGPCQCGF